MYVFICGLFIISMLIYNIIRKKHSYWKEKNVTQCEPTFLIGNLTDLLLKKKSQADLIEDIYNKYSDIRYVGIYQFLQPTLIVLDPDLLKLITVKDFEHFTDHRTFTEEVDNNSNWGSNLFSLRGDRWKEMRVTLGPIFTASKMRMLFSLVNDCGKNFTNYLIDKKENTLNVELQDLFTRALGDITAITIFGVSIDCFKEPENEFFTTGIKAISSPVGVKMFLLGVLPSLFNKFFSVFPANVTTFLRELVISCIELREKHNIVRPDLIHILLEAKKGLLKNQDDFDTDIFGTKQNYYQKFKKKHEITNDDIVGQCFIFFFAGFETTKTLLSFGGYVLATNQDIQEKLRKEIVAVLKENDGIVTYDGIMKMKYLEMVLFEVLRLYPPVPFVDRNCVKSYTIEPINSNEKPVHLEKNDIIWIPIYGLHKDPKYYPDPEKFVPERFSAENKELIKACTFVPFGNGPRTCIASRFALLQAKVILVNLLTKFEIIPTEETKIPEFSKTHITTYAEHGIHVGLRCINNN